MSAFITLLLFSPLLGSAFNLIARPKSAKISGGVATGAAALSFLCALALCWEYKHSDLPLLLEWPWITAGRLEIAWGFSFDALTCLMTLVVTGIGSLIHLYSIGYMSEDPSPARYFGYLNLFLFAMLVLVTADNLAVLFVGWEGVGLCSYLLIGFWYTDLAKSNAGLKAFVVNRIGDAGFLIGMFLCFSLFQSLDFDAIGGVLARSNTLDLRWLNLAAFFLFVGAVGKSAQIPLFVWLPDAMAGPTPVSALIHAATMVTAGVYLVARMSFLFQITAVTSTVIATVGAATALFAATIATSQNDIKKVLAYSTVSQLGYMVLALGVGSYFGAVFHLMTHAFFKALLFLGAGSVIHALSGEQDILKMGGLRKKLPFTFWTFSVAVVAIAGIPPLSGFFSKDTVLYAVLSSETGNLTLWGVGIFTSFLTAFYMGRLYCLVFLGEYRGAAHPHESPAVMTIPLVCLGIGSVVAGWIGMPHGLHLLPNYLEEFLSLPPVNEAPLQVISEHLAMGLATLSGILGVGFALMLYAKGPSKAQSLVKFLGPVPVIFQNKYWVDELYDLVLVRPFRLLCRLLATIVDPKWVDATLLFPAKVAYTGAGMLSKIQSGFTQVYLWIMLLGALVMAWILLNEVIL